MKMILDIEVNQNVKMVHLTLKAHSN